MIRCGNRSVHSRGYGEAFDFTLTDNKVRFGGVEDEAGGARTAGQCDSFTFIRNAYCAGCLVECLYILLTELLNDIGRCDRYICCILDWWRKPSGFLTPDKRVGVW